MGLLLFSSLIFCSLAAGHVIQRGRRQIDVESIRWDDNIVPFIIESGFSDAEQLKIYEAMNHISNNTCIVFKDVTGRKGVSYGIKCSGLGRPYDPGFQTISLHTGPTKDCLDTIGVVVHEILHALGFEHTISRQDRDAYISINFKNIHARNRPQFEMYPVYKYSQYDYSSNVHYASHLTWNSSSINPLQPTILNNNDMETVKCRHRGVANPNNRSTCLCPEGYVGKRCELRPDRCGYIMHAKHTFDTVRLNIGHPSKGKEFKYETCVSWIKAPKGYDVEVEILSVTAEGVGHVTLQEKISCRQYGIEVKIKGNPRPGGPVFCMPDDIQQRFISRTPMAPIVLYNRIGYQEYKIRYRATKRFHRKRKAEARV